MNTRKIIFSLVVLSIYLSYYACNATEYHVVDGDSLEYGTERIRLQGIDAPEYVQSCQDEKKQDYPCGIEAKKYLNQLISPGITCVKYGKDKYGRSLKECFLRDGTSINQKMVSSGWAVSYGEKFKSDERDAKNLQKGIWKGKFMRPELYRALSSNKQKNKKR